jgi:hypothetical protein
LYRLTWFSWFVVFFIQPTILFDGWQENHLQFQLASGRFQADALYEK